MKQVSRIGIGALMSLTILLTGCVPESSVHDSGSVSADNPSSSVSEPGPDQSQKPDESQKPDQSQKPDESQTPDQSQKPDQSQEPDQSVAANKPKTAGYDFSGSVPESEAVDNTYFSDAAFVGDSRTDGFMIYSGIGQGDNLTSNGLSIFQLSDTTKKTLKIKDKKYSLVEALSMKKYGKVYLSLGVNELGYYNDEGFYKAYLDAIDTIRATQPQAVIYIQGLIPLNENVIAATGGRSYLKNDHLRIYNDLMKKAAEEKQVAFLDLNPYFAGPDGQLPADASKDGVHLKADYCKKWLEYLKVHTVSYDTLYPQGVQA